VVFGSSGCRIPDAGYSVHTGSSNPQRATRNYYFSPRQPFFPKLHLYICNTYVETGTNTGTLIIEAKQGSTAAQRYLFDLLSGKMMMFCRRYVKSPEDAEELMLDGFYKFFKSIHSFHYQNDAALLGWLKKIMLNECLMFLRKKHVFTIVTDAAAEEIPVQDNALDTLSAAEIFNLVVQLPVGYRTVFNLYAVEGMMHAEIASALGISEGTSKSQLSKAKLLLQKMLLNKGTEYVKRKSK
jgi:RNA polymerase sigma factor (sigma-70 family)